MKQLARDSMACREWQTVKLMWMSTTNGSTGME